MVHSVFIYLAAALLVLSVGHADVIRKPQAPISIAFAQGHIDVALRAARSKKFTGTFKGKHNIFGIAGTDEGTFSGMTKKKKTTGKVNGKSKGKVDMFGTKGSYSSRFAAKFQSVVKGKKYRVKYEGDFDFEYEGVYGGKEFTGKAGGSYTGDFRNGKFVMKERGTVDFRVGGTMIKGRYKGVFEGETYSMKMTGTVGGKKFSVKWELTLEDIQKMVTHDGTYVIECNGKKTTGKYRDFNFFPSE